MKKFLAIVLIFLCFNVSFASVPVIVPTLKASEIFIPVGETGQKISLLELSRINIKNFELLRGEKMKLFDRLGFKIAQKKLRDNINIDGTFNNKKLIKAITKSSEGQGGGGSVLAAIEGLALGFFLWAIGVLIAYLIKDKYKKIRVICAWIGFALLTIGLIRLIAGI